MDWRTADMRMTDIGEEAGRIPFEIATSIMNVDSKWLCTFSF
jgi:hypothetical protein